jgi:hypothetical protein
MRNQEKEVKMLVEKIKAIINDDLKGVMEYTYNMEMYSGKRFAEAVLEDGAMAIEKIMRVRLEDLEDDYLVIECNNLQAIVHEHCPDKNMRAMVITHLTNRIL